MDITDWVGKGDSWISDFAQRSCSLLRGSSNSATKESDFLLRGSSNSAAKEADFLLRASSNSVAKESDFLDLNSLRISFLEMMEEDANLIMPDVADSRAALAVDSQAAPWNARGGDGGENDCSQEQDEEEPKEHTSLEAFDIICGRQSESLNHVGNRRFRVTINLYLQRYRETANTRKKRIELITEIIETLNAAGAKFLKQKRDSYVELSEREVRQKVAHALRDMAHRRA